MNKLLLSCLVAAGAICSVLADGYVTLKEDDKPSGGVPASSLVSNTKHWSILGAPDSDHDYYVDTGDVTELDGFEETHGLVTVPTAEADHVRACIKAVKPFGGVKMTVVETTDATTGTTTFSARFEKRGLLLIVR